MISAWFLSLRRPAAQIPFGPAAFIPGRLVHTNEFLVLLGSEYYAEMSAKQARAAPRRSPCVRACAALLLSTCHCRVAHRLQTVELLKRREVQIAETVRKGREATGQLRSRKDAVGARARGASSGQLRWLSSRAVCRD